MAGLPCFSRVVGKSLDKRQKADPRRWLWVLYEQTGQLECLACSPRSLFCEITCWWLPWWGPPIRVSWKTTSDQRFLPFLLAAGGRPRADACLLPAQHRGVRNGRIAGRARTITPLSDSFFTFHANAGCFAAQSEALCWDDFARGNLSSGLSAALENSIL